MATNPYMETERCRGQEDGKSRAVALGVAAACVLAAISWCVTRVPAASVTRASLTTASGTHLAPATGLATLTERVAFDGVEEGGLVDVSLELHELSAYGHDRGLLVQEGMPTIAHARLEVAEGAVELPVTVDAGALAGSSLRAQVEVERDGRELTPAADDATSQTMCFPGVSCELASGGLAADATSVSTNVCYEGLMVGEPVEVRLALEDADGTPVSAASAEFVPATCSGAQVVELPLDAARLAGQQLCLRAQVISDGETVARSDVSGSPTMAMPSIDQGLSRANVTTTDVGILCVSRTVGYAGLVAGTPYTLTTRALDAASGEAIAGSEATVGFVPEAPSGTVEVTQHIDDIDHARASFALEDAITLQDGTVVARAATGSGQGALSLPAATSRTTGIHTGMATEPASEGASLRSAITYSNLVPGMSYVAEGTLSATAADGTDLGTLSHSDGSPVRAENAFVASADTGTVELVYALDATELAGATVTPSERILSDSCVACEATCTAVTFPRLSVSASTGSTSGDASSVAVDVAADGLPEGTATLGITLTDTTSGLAAWMPDGTEARVTRTIDVGGDGRGDVHVEFPLDATRLAGHAVTATATAEADGRIVAMGGVWDECATVHLPTLDVGLVDAASGSHTLYAQDEATLVASVSCQGLDEAAGNAVTVTLRDADTGEEVCGPEGSPLSATSEVPSEDGEGSVDVYVDVDPGMLAGRDIVAHAELSAGDATATTEATTPVRVPGVSVTPQDASVGAEGRSVAVSYTNLEPGRAHVVSATLASEDGTVCYQGSTTLTPERADGTITVSLTGTAGQVTEGPLTARAEILADGVRIATTPQPAVVADATHVQVGVAEETAGVTEVPATTGGRHTSPATPAGPSPLPLVVAVTGVLLVATGALAMRSMQEVPEELV